MSTFEKLKFRKIVSVSTFENEKVQNCLLLEIKNIKKIFFVSTF